MSELSAREVLIDIFGSGDFDHEIIWPAAAADLVIEKLRDAGFEIVPADRGSAAQAMPEETQPCHLTALLRL